MVQVAIGIVRRANQILICRRRTNNAWGGFWEFPGGKLELDESPTDGLIRELREEVAIEIRITHTFQPIDHAYPKGAVRLHPFLCELVDGIAQPLASDELKWIAPHELRNYPFPPANDALKEELIRMHAAPVDH